jgi:mRNA interferase HigB
MHVISQRPLRRFWTAHPGAERPLKQWYRTVKKAEWGSFAEVRATYAHADQVDRFTVFNIGGNKFRLVAVIHYNRGKIYVRHVLTHREYDRDDWKND